MWSITLRLLLISILVLNLTCAIPINNDDTTIENAINHCTHLCKACYGEPHFDKLEAKCYCLLRKFNSSQAEDNECRETMKTNAKILDIDLIIDDSFESKIRVPRSDDAVIAESQASTSAPDFLNFSDSAHTVLGGEDSAKITTKQEEEVTEAPSLLEETNSNLIAQESQVNEVVEMQAVEEDNVKNRGKTTKKTSSTVQELVQETRNKFNDFIDRHQSGNQTLKEAQNSIKEIQTRLLQMANRIRTKPEGNVQAEASPRATVTLQEKIREITAKLRATANKQKVGVSENDQMVEESNPAAVVTSDIENDEEADPVVGQPRRHIHRRRRPLRRHRNRTPEAHHHHRSSESHHHRTPEAHHHRAVTPEVQEHHHEHHHHIDNPELEHHQSEVQERIHEAEVQNRIHESEMEARTRHRQRNLDDVPRRHRLAPRRHRERLEARQSVDSPIVQPPETLQDENATSEPEPTTEAIQQEISTTEPSVPEIVNEITNIEA